MLDEIYDVGPLTKEAQAEPPRQHQLLEKASSTNTFIRRAIPATQREPEPARMQAKLLTALRTDFPNARLSRK
jgi:hypothetical protein